MMWASYKGAGSFLGHSWHNGLSWQCVAYWPDQAALWPNELNVSMKAPQLGVRLHNARLTYREGLAGSFPVYASDQLLCSGFTQRNAPVTVTLKFEEHRDDRVVFSGVWHEFGRAGPIREEIELQGDLGEHGFDDLPIDCTDNVPARCDVQHLAISLQALLVKLDDGQELTFPETQHLRTCIAEYKSRSCSSKICRPGNCALRQQHECLTYLGYKDIRDVLHTTKSGIHAEPPRLLKRAGLETLAVMGMRRSGHYNP